MTGGPIDLKAMVCGLVPEIGRLLRESAGDEVRMLLHKGVESELAHVFGGGDWEYEVESRPDCELVIFRRRKAAPSNPLSMF